jgi:riboflavin kinase/FMN adenylyltransferase
LVYPRLIPLLAAAAAQRPTAIAIGSFDGLHAGHRRVIEAVTGPGEGLPTVVSFWPHPREVLHGERRLRLDLPAEKLSVLAALGIRQLVLVPFDRELAALSPERFVERVLVGQLAARRIAVGENFRFGAGRCGDAAELHRIAAARGIAVQVVPMLHDARGRVSSSRIRQALAAADLAEAGRLLQRPYRFSGPVVSGRGLGRQLGWPTANLAIDPHKFLPMEGVYAALVRVQRPGTDFHLDRQHWWAAVMNLGPQPTVDPAAPSAVEVHLLDRRIDLTDCIITVQPLALLRTQQRFACLEALTAQIGADAERARALTAGVGVAEPPTDEGGDPPQQQDA